MNSVPFLFTVLLSVLAWTTSEIISVLENSPVIEITSKSYDLSNKKLTYVLTNVSNSILFNNLIFEISGDNAKCVGELNVYHGPPNMKGENTKPSECSGGNSAEFAVEEFHPASMIRLVGTFEFTLNQDNSALYLKSKSAVKVLPSGLQTFLIKNKLEILVSLFTLWFILILTYMFAVKRKWLDANE